ncbi:flagellar biosynthetic protein FliO [Rhizobium sp. ARZ01]|uniref:flagellar biosynthetic protein FliO n=1 Tax=Rhizobium sp. ARZ01 TaxID=2769313 RepID=UPI001783F54F|nr:flagellar biosynthetic protein FliO [Rhizobium sp. ARZ01]MBD9372571.1 flagellar biosynthetic protein FliO [Rhizobium sp. ARZ01]
MFEDIIAQYGTKFLIAAVAVLAGLACLALALWVVRRRPSSPFIRGGRNRQPRLSVLDAAAVDTRRRLVLVRRDDVEHLLMIGGPTDIVIESRIITASPGDLAEQPQPAPIAVAPVAAASPPTAEPYAAVPVPARPATAVAPPPVASVGTALKEERFDLPARGVPPSGVSAMGQVLYGDDEPASVPTPPFNPSPLDIRPATSTAAIGITTRPPVAPQPSISERNAIDALDRARDRVLTNPVGTGSERVSEQRDLPIQREPSPAPARTTPDNAALVSEFEKILEAEIASPTRSANNSLADGRRTEPSTIESQLEQPASREETEAEMARLLGELSANRKS